MKWLYGLHYHLKLSPPVLRRAVQGRPGDACAANGRVLQAPRPPQPRAPQDARRLLVPALERARGYRGVQQEEQRCLMHD